MADIDRRTGEVIDNYQSALQSVEIIFSTFIGEMVMLREFGAGALDLLGRKMTARLFLVFRTALMAGINAWEPRFRVRHVGVDGTVEGVRLGEVRFAIEIDWRPRAHLVPPDYSVESVRTFGLQFLETGVRAA
ncbi:baseplate component [Aurantimonas phage AmM-1]|uniref:baseplate wedge subunit n=1 Tax=Aurantimonas phage AmM-1 TaxID=1503929 RepID=UPI000540CBA3|nr:baseplate wedge subunit [Aurantimonas phage AmM-1]BAP94471.1 baseplate component [Aurantimonas phage AmM-1]